VALSELERRIYNNGERLIPGVMHGMAEVARHRASYLFFRQVIALDEPPARILDVGCGVGHGCVTLSTLPGSKIVGVDVSLEAIEYANSRYARPNVEYRIAGLDDVADELADFDYVVARASLEHISGGIDTIACGGWRRRLLFDVPYDEASGVNEHHVLHGIREEELLAIDGAEVFYQSLRGTIRSSRRGRPNVLACVVSRPGLPDVSPSLSFPVSGWSPSSVAGKIRLWGDLARIAPRLIAAAFTN